MYNENKNGNFQLESRKCKEEIFTHLVLFHLIFWTVSYTVEKDGTKSKTSCQTINMQCPSIIIQFLGHLLEGCWKKNKSAWFNFHRQHLDSRQIFHISPSYVRSCTPLIMNTWCQTLAFGLRASAVH